MITKKFLRTSLLTLIAFCSVHEIASASTRENTITVCVNKGASEYDMEQQCKGECGNAAQTGETLTSAKPVGINIPLGVNTCGGIGGLLSGMWNNGCKCVWTSK